MKVQSGAKTVEPTAEAITKKLQTLPLARPTTADCGDGSCGCGCDLPISR